MHEIFDAPEWFEALTLAERAALLGPGIETPPPAEHRERAARRAARWRSEADLQDDSLFAERLALDGLTPERFLRVLAEPAAGLRQRAASRPGWLQLLERTFSQSSPPIPLPAGDLGVLELLRPLAADAYARVLAGLRQLAMGPPGHSGLLEPEAIAADLFEVLLRRLRWAGERALALELQASRLEGTLYGDTPEERFASFVERLCQPAAALEILRRYPVLARDACRHAEQWVASSLELFERYAADRGEIVSRLTAGADPGPVTGARTGLSDRHRGGRSVAILSFAAGLRIVYKPKPLAIDGRFQELIAWLNERGAEPPLRPVAVLDRGSHGWMEHVAARPCETAAGLERFHQRQGAWIAVFYALAATDFHHENLIAEGEHPVPIDLETLCHPAPAEPAAGGPGYLPTAQTVLHSGLLPRRFGATAADTSGARLDMSGMGAFGGQPYAMRRITGDGTDQMRWALHAATLAAGPHLPALDGEPVALWEHGEPVLHGFRSMYRLLCRHREALLAPDGPLARLAGLPVRALLRGTSVYGYLLHLGNHPDYLQSALDRGRLADRLWLDAVRYPPLRQAVRAEQEELAAGDIPLFGAVTGSTDLLLPTGRRVAGYFAASGLDLVRHRLPALSEADLGRQAWLARCAIEATRPLGESRIWPEAPLPAASAAPPERFLAAARTIGDRLEHLAFVEGGLATWFQLDLRPDGWRLEPLPSGLYSGHCGLALFLAHLGRLSGEERYGRLARLALDSARKRIEADPAQIVHLGAWSGWGGLVYTLTHLGLLWREPKLLTAAEDLALHRLPEAGIEADTVLDLMAGSAGAAAALLALYRHRPSPALLAVAVRCGERLLAAAVVEKHADGSRWAWPPPAELGGVPLAGFSHGAAGIAWALAHLAQATGEERFRDAARGALRYERSWFSAEHGNWPDLRQSRETAAGRAFQHAWCHGAPGIGLGRIGTLPVLSDPEMLAEIRAAARSTLKHGFGANQCLCHGDLGNLELIREAGRVLNDPELAAEGERLAAGILERIESEGPRCGAGPQTEGLGLMTGLAGIGYGLLRAAWPDRVPSVLLLET